MSEGQTSSTVASRPLNADGGFTLVEVATVLVILGILAAIALPVFLQHRERAYDAAAQSDLRVVLVLMEVYRSNHGGFSEDALDVPEARFEPSDGVVWDLSGVHDDAYCVAASHEQSSNSWEIRDTVTTVTKGDCS